MHKKMKSYRGSNQHLKNKLRLNPGKIYAQIYNWNSSSLILGTKMLHLRCLTRPPLCKYNSYFWIFLQKNLSWGPFFGKVSREPTKLRELRANLGYVGSWVTACVGYVGAKLTSVAWVTQAKGVTNYFTWVNIYYVGQNFYKGQFFKHWPKILGGWKRFRWVKLFYVGENFRWVWVFKIWREIA